MKIRAETSDQHYDVLVVGSGFGGSVTALRLTEKGYRVGCSGGGPTLGRRRLCAEHLGCQALHVGTQTGAQGNSANTSAARCDGARGGRCRRRLTGLLQCALRAQIGCLLHRQAVGAHHGLASGTRSLLRPGQEDVGLRRKPDVHRRGRADQEGRRRDGRRAQLRTDAGRRLLRSRRPKGTRRGRRGSVLRRYGPTAQRLHRMRRMHDRLSPRRQEHPGEELSVPGGIGRRGHPSGAHRDCGATAARRWLPGRSPAGPAPGAGESTIEPSPPTTSSSPQARGVPNNCCTG